MWIKCVDAVYFLEGLNSSCSLLGSMKLESSSLGSGSGTAWAPTILRARMSGKKKMKVAERQVQKQGITALVWKPLGLALLGLLSRIFWQISSFVCIFVSLLGLGVECLVWLFGQDAKPCSQFLFFCPEVFLKEKLEQRQRNLWWLLAPEDGPEVLQRFFHSQLSLLDWLRK